MRNSFTLQLRQQLQPGQVTIGRFDGRSPSLTCATTAGRIFIHNSAAAASGSASDLVFLNINRPVTSLVAGPMKRTGRDVLLVGTPTDLMGYDVHKNCDLFFCEVPDGVNAMTLGKIGRMDRPLALVGGNCSIQGFDVKGSDRFWTVTGDNVSALALVDVDGDGKAELLVGSEDFDLRAFKEDGEMVLEFSEQEAVCGLCELGKGRFGFVTLSGAIGVYEGSTCLWRTQMKHTPISITSFAVTHKGERELIVGWADGRVEARNSQSGDVVFADQLASSIAGIVTADYKMDGNDTLIVCSVDGEVRGYIPEGAMPKDMGPAAAPAPAVVDTEFDARQLQELSQRKQDMIAQVKYLQSRLETVTAKPSKRTSLAPPTGERASLEHHLAAVAGDPSTDTKPSVRLTFTSGPGTYIQAVMLFNEGLFEGSHCLVVHPLFEDVKPHVEISLFPPADQEYRISTKLIVGARGSHDLYVHEPEVLVPRFALFAVDEHVDELAQASESRIAVPLSGGVDFARVVAFVNSNFLLESPLPADSKFVCLKSMRTASTLVIRSDKSELVVASADADLATSIVEALFTHLGIQESNSTMFFPKEADSLRSVLLTVDELQSVRQKLTAEMSDNSGMIKSLVLRAEDSRIMDDMSGMRESFMQLNALNRDLINAYNIRCSNHNELLRSLRTVNQHIQRAGRARVGRPKKEVIARCRQAIKNNDVGLLFKTIQDGVP